MAAYRARETSTKTLTDHSTRRPASSRRCSSGFPSPDRSWWCISLISLTFSSAAAALIRCWSLSPLTMVSRCRTDGRSRTCRLAWCSAAADFRVVGRK